MGKKQLHHHWTRFRKIHPLVLVALILMFGSVSVFALQQNNLKMGELRQAVYTADEENGDVEAALRELRQYVHAHMNTDLSAGTNAVYPPIQLEHTYKRLVAAEQERIKQVNENIYTQAQAYCERLYPESFSGGPRVPCIREYVTERGVEANKIQDSLYKFDFVSPFWSPDLAGWSVLATIALTALLLVRLAVPRILKYFDVL